MRGLWGSLDDWECWGMGVKGEGGWVDMIEWKEWVGHGQKGG